MLNVLENIIKFNLLINIQYNIMPIRFYLTSKYAMYTFVYVI